MQNAREVVILGAGAVGVAAAWQLQQRGWRVTLIDRKQPASETSFGNAGIVAESAAVPFNNPATRRQLPRLLFGSSPVLHWRFSYLAANLPWYIQFLYHSNQRSALARARALHQLIKRGAELHQEWLAVVGKTHHIQRGGWLKLYRSERSFQQAASERAFWQSLAVPHRIIAADAIADLLPAAAAALFPRAVLIEQAFAIINPAAAIRAYADAFIADGGVCIEQEVSGLQQKNSGWQVQLKGGDQHPAAHVVVALGPWCREFLSPLGIRLPLGFERGAHRHFEITSAAPTLPFADMDGGYSAVMQEKTLRMTSGVYLASLTAPPQRRQLAAAEQHLRQAINGVGKVVGEDWYGARPTLPDCLPVIGASRRRGLWLAGGCQHIGLMSSPAVGECLAQLLNGDAPAVEAAAFSPRRYNL